MAAVAAAALAAVLSRALGDSLGGCTPAQRAAVLGSAGVTTLGSAAGRPVVLASVHGACICGNVNCPYVVAHVRSGGDADVLLVTYAYEVTPLRSGTPLPNLHEVAHDSALVSDETIDAYRNGRYVPIATARVRGDTGARKPNAVPLRFAAGASSRVVRGRVAFGWYDEYALGAARGQRLAVSDVRSPARLRLSLVPPDGNAAIDLAPGTAAVLNAGGTYLLRIEGSGDALQPYSAAVSIR